MRPYPSLPSFEDAASTLLDGGHLWLQEYVPGPILGVKMDDSGMLTFSVDGSEFADPPPSLVRTVEHVRKRFDRDRFRSGVSSVDDFVFYGIATRNEGREYEWSDVAPFLGLDIWSFGEGRYVSPDVTERVFSTIGLDPVPAFRKEVPSQQFHPASFDVPTSHWGNDPAAGLIVRNKRGSIAVYGYDPPKADPGPVEDLDATVKPFVSRNLDRVLEELGADVRAIDDDVLADRLFEIVARVGFYRLASSLEREPTAVRQSVGSVARSLVRTRLADGDAP
ncbi:MAG: hypothetical protein ABEJ76_07255 [Halanaeroarchaeum sp.]